MEKSKVYFTDMHATGDCNLLDKIEKLVIKAGIKNIDFKDKFVCIKIHFGEPGNLAYLRPNYGKKIVELLESLGAKVFYSDCNTLYVGGRKNAIDHLESAYANGYNPFSAGAHVIIGDGLKGTDEIEVPVIGGKHFTEAKIGRAIMDADIFITLNHFKGHEATGFGGALKNIGMGCGSRAGKMAMHNSSKPVIDGEKCKVCHVCSKICAHNAISFKNIKADINHIYCVGCGRCIGVCNFDAIHTMWDEANDVLNEKIAEYSFAVLNGRPNFHISLAIDISPYCDCHSENDMPICADVGMFASFDPVALDVACADACNASPVISDSLLDKSNKHCDDHFTNVHPETNWKTCIEHAKKLGLGNDEYELIIIK